MFNQTKKVLSKPLFAIPFCMGLGIISTSQADQRADTVVDDIDFSGTDATRYLEAPDFIWSPLGVFEGTPGKVTLGFTDNICFADGTAADDVSAIGLGFGACESFRVNIGATTLSPSVVTCDNTTPRSHPFNYAMPAGTMFMDMEIEGLSPAGSGAILGDGADFDAAECHFTLSASDIYKEFEVNPLDTDESVEIITREKGDMTIQHKAFSITLENNTGMAGADTFANLIIKDAVPAEYDLDPAAEDFRYGGTNNCDDGNCDGIDHGNGILCIVTTSRNNGASANGKNGNKLEPELLDIDASGLNNTESCTVTIYVRTDVGHKKSATPTSCPVNLNSGVKVFSGTMDLLLQSNTLSFGPAADFDPDSGIGWCDDGTEDDPLL